MRLDPAYFGYAIGTRPPRWPLALKRSSPQARGLAAAWPLFAGLGVGFQDLSGHGAGLVRGTGTQEPIQSVRPGLDARVPDFDGGDEMHVAGGDVASLDITGNEIALAAWIRPDTTGTTGGSRIVSKRTNSGGSEVYALFTIDQATQSNDGVWFRLQTSTGTTNLKYNTLVTTGVWQHWCATYDATTMRLYHNGVEVASTGKTGNIANSARAVYLGHREAETRYFNGAMAEVRVYDRTLSAREVFALYDPATRWGLYRELNVPRVWPAKLSGAPTTRTAIGSLQAVLQRQASLLTSTDTALRAEAVVSALAGAALRANVSRGASLDLAIQAVRQAQAGLGTALIRALGLDAGLDANLTAQGAAQRAAALDAAIRRLSLLSGALEAALRAPKLDAAALDAWLALILGGFANLDAVARRGDRLASTALQGALRATPGRAAALDAILGLVVTAALSRTQTIGARGGHRVARGQRRSLIPPGNRRH